MHYSTEPLPGVFAQGGSLDELLEDASDLAALPQVVMQVIDLTMRANAAAADIERIVNTDPALAVKILRLANSSYYGLPRRLLSVREAIVFLGFKAVRNLATTITAFHMFMGKSDQDSLARRAIWRHSLDTAQCARTIATLLPPQVTETFGADEAFTCGLLHDIGKMVLDHSRHLIFTRLTQMAEARGARYYELEAQVLPFGHAQIGSALAERWNLPRGLCEAIACHHEPGAATVNPRLTALVHMANEVAHLLAATRGERAATEAWAALWQQSRPAATMLRISPDALPTLGEACRTELAKGLSQCSFG